MKLTKLIEGMDVLNSCGPEDIEVKGICVDSRKVREDDIFIAVKGHKVDGHDFIADAVKRGAVAVISQKDVKIPKITLIVVKNCRKILSEVSNIFYDFPSQKLKIVGITGTNGKSTIAYVAQHILLSSGRKTGRLGTLGYHMSRRQIPATKTTPSPPQLQQYLSDMVKEGAEYAVMEVSSHALAQDRVRDIDFAEAVFTNVTLDHLDYHLSMSRYVETKYKFFEEVISHETMSVINADSSHCIHLSRISAGGVITYGFKSTADVRAESVVFGSHITEFDLIIAKSETKHHIKTDLLCRFNVSNLLAAITICLELGVTINEITTAVSGIGPIPGRLEKIECGQPFTVLVDFAHTPDAIKLVLTELREITRGRLIIVFGCGGDRDRSKRPLMGKIAACFADKTIITSDNPRTEDPEDIGRQILNGVPEGKDCVLILDRYEAIKSALSTAQPDDLVIIAGKGHESCQILKDTMLPFDDRQVTRALLGARS